MQDEKKKKIIFPVSDQVILVIEILHNHSAFWLDRL